MRLGRVRGDGGDQALVLIDDETAVIVTELAPEYSAGRIDVNEIERLASSDVSDLEAFSLLGANWLPPVAQPGKILCVGLNYVDHARETGQPLPTEPILFTKAPEALTGANGTIFTPPTATKLDWEVELAVIIGKPAVYLENTESAIDSILGYCLANDVSERAFQTERGGQWTKGKSAPSFLPLGPWMATAASIPNVDDISLRLTVNGDVAQNGNTSQLIFDVPHLVWYITQFMALSPGDIILTGTPPGVGHGMQPPRYLLNGDVIEATATGLGTQRNVVRPWGLLPAMVAGTPAL